jgi:hypothetical protein
MQRPDDPRDWSADDVEQFALHATGDEIQAVTLNLAAAGDPGALRILKLFLSTRGGTTYEKRLPAVLAGRALLQTGPAGVDVLAGALTRGPRPRYVSALLRMLWRAGRGDFGPDLHLEGFGPRVKELDPPEGTDEAARRALSDYLAEVIVNPDHLTDVGTWLQQVSILPAVRAEADAASDMSRCWGRRRSGSRHRYLMTMPPSSRKTTVRRPISSS